VYCVRCSVNNTPNTPHCNPWMRPYIYKLKKVAKSLNFGIKFNIVWTKF
jgi:hypothetical protein